jgi:hypothetical protein
MLAWNVYLIKGVILNILWVTLTVSDVFFINQNIK